MLKIRLQRIGRKNDPYFRIIVTPHQNKLKTTSFVEILGTFNVQKGDFECKADRVKYWMSVGAQISPTIHNHLISKGIIEGKKLNVLSKKSPIKKVEKAK